MVKPLTVYKASAGSGKTFTLAVEYIKLLIQNTDEYKHILAVTFTNKATGEMKTRILTTLFGLANNCKSSDNYLDVIKKDEKIKALNLDDSSIRKRCADALNKIIHDYSRFRIETIDSFFQSIIRDLTRELDLTANLRVDLNAEEVLEEAVNTIIEELDKTNDVFESVYHFVQEKIQAGGNWQINYEVSKFGKNIFKEDFLRNRETITNSIKDAKQLRRYKAELQKMKASLLDDCKKVGSDFISAMASEQLEFKDIKNGDKIVGSFMRKLAAGEAPDITATMQKYADDASSMFSKNAQAGIVNNFTTNIHPMLVVIVNQFMPKVTTAINSIDAICKHLNHLMLLNVINDKVRTLNNEANRFLLADSAHFLNEIIDGSDIPFVYEKAGTWFRHIMIDEFQDTSALQWENFKPLIRNSMDNYESCLIVGDVKQSIYRWRDSDWQILNKRINDEFERYLNPVSLQTNYRSSGRVIHFNNQFFKKATQIINEEYKKLHNTDSQDLLMAYSDVRQLVPEKNENKGYVCVNNYVSDDYIEETPRRILETVKKLHEDGIDWNDMTILVRKNKAIPELCKYFNEHSDEIDTKIVSDEAFRLDSSAAVNLIILALTAITNPNDRFALCNLAIHYQMAVQNDDSIKNQGNRFFLATDEELAELLPEGFMENMQKYSFTPLHELTEELYCVLDLQKIPNQDSYLFYFHDQINCYVQDNLTDIDNFLTYWDEKMCEKTIPNGASDGIRIMSIHKSKGLEFHTVIVPYCDWGTGGNYDDLLWCKPLQDPYKELPIVPVNYSNTLDNSIFRNEYREEVLRNNVDNLNLIYVAFTRASRNLVVLTGSKPRKSKPTSINNIQQIIVSSMNMLTAKDMTAESLGEVPIELIEEGEGESSVWYYGEPIISEEKEEEEADNILDKKYTDVKTEFVHEEANIEFRQSNESKKLLFEDDEEDAVSDDFIQRGLIYHKIFELLTTKDDVDRVIDEMDGCGYFESVVSVDEARKNIKAALQHPVAGRWFESGWKQFNECAILYRDSSGKIVEKRPDRVIVNDDEVIVIDYKSGHEDHNYNDQVLTYISLLQRMGYKNIKGYIWYFMKNKIEDVFEVKGGEK